ncbi:hypothetical protein RHSIM_Rhsim09G0169400 [Rhododendron simsii]|uniref:Serine/threonine specific protein phosphatases domain-containing protein n=1 Tax=Rhododendron simsii TaxID=118357 RepID=A0A834LCP4_RHOSS|nr:hypothetical protein RHSIM_Rhsim09G0169400 [Rhododendron simsii]
MNFADPSTAFLAAAGGHTVKLFDASVESGDPCTLSYTPSPGFQVTFMANTVIYYGYLSMGAFLLKPIFGPDKVSEFLAKHDLDLVCRAHQVVEDGYESFAERQLVTVFSAPNYCGEFDNAGSLMSVDENLMCSFQILKPAEKMSKFMMSTKM